MTTDEAIARIRTEEKLSHSIQMLMNLRYDATHNEFRELVELLAARAMLIGRSDELRERIAEIAP